MIIHNSASKTAIYLWTTVDNSVENPIFQRFLQKALWIKPGITVGEMWENGG